MTKKIGWKNGCWDYFNNLHIPIDDRGLNFGDGIFETVFIHDKQPKLLKAHLDRWQRNARQLSMASPPSQKVLEPIINEGLTLVIMSCSASKEILSALSMKNSIRSAPADFP